MAVWKWSQTPYSDQHYQRMADLSLRTGQAKAQTQQQLWNTVGSSLMDLPRSVQQASYYETLGQRQEQALEEERAEKQRTDTYATWKNQFAREGGGTDWDVGISDIENLGSFVGPRRPDSYAFVTTPDGNQRQLSTTERQNLITAARGEKREEQNIMAEELLRSRQLNNQLATDMTDALEGIQGSSGTVQEHYDALQRLGDPDGDLIKFAMFIDSLGEGTANADLVRKVSSTPWVEFIGQPGKTESDRFRDPDWTGDSLQPVVRQGDEWPWLERKITEGMSRKQTAARAEAAAERIKIMSLLGADFNRPFRSMPPGHQEFAVANIAKLVDLPRVESQEDLDQEWLDIDEALGGWLTRNSEVRDVFEEKGLSHWPTQEDVEANKGLFTGQQAQTPENLFKLRLKDAGIDSPLIDAQAEHHEMLVFATASGLLPPGASPPRFATPEWIALSYRFGKETGNWYEYDTAMELAGIEARGGKVADTGVTPTQERAASRDFVERYSKLTDQAGTSTSSEELLEMGLEHKNDGRWITETIDGKPLQDSVTIDGQVFYSPRAFELSKMPPEMRSEQNIVMSFDAYDESLRSIQDRYMAAINAPSQRMDEQLFRAWEERVSGSGSGENIVPPELPSNWPKAKDVWGNETDGFESYESIKLRDPATLERLFAEWASEFGIDELSKIYPSAHTFDYSLYPKFVDRLLSQRGGPIYLHYTPVPVPASDFPRTQGEWSRKQREMTPRRKNKIYGRTR